MVYESPDSCSCVLADATFNHVFLNHLDSVQSNSAYSHLQIHILGSEFKAESSPFAGLCTLFYKDIEAPWIHLLSL